jgi:hypothetical protein
MVGLSQLMCGLPLGYTVHTSAFACGTPIAATLANINRLANDKRIFVPLTVAPTAADQFATDRSTARERRRG